MYSRLIGGDGFCFPRELAQRAKDIGCPAIALTDHGTMAGTAEFYRDCQKIGIKPILGTEAYITPMGHSLDERVVYDIKDMRGKPGYVRSNYHLILLAKNDIGWRNLTELSKQSFARGYYYKPRIDHELLKEHHEGIICSAACILGEVANLAWCDDYVRMREVAQWYQEVFGEDYYLEVMYHGLDMERKALAPVRDLGKELGIKIIATNDSHYSVKSEYKLHKALMLDKMHKSFADADVSGSFFGEDDETPQRGIEEEGGDSNPIFETSSELYIKDWDEMVMALAIEGATEEDVARELATTLEIATKCNYELPIIDPTDMSAYYTPVYPVEKDLQYDDFKDSHFEIKQSTVDAIIEEMHKDGREGSKLEDFLDDHEMLSLRFLMWMCDKGLKENVLPKLEARGEALPMEFWCENPPEGFSIRHTHNSPDELWIREQMQKGLSVDDMIQVYQDRIDYEVAVVVRKGFIDYFSVVQNYANFTKLNGSVMGPGRGSGGGSLLLYLLSITSIDPIPNKLLFFRFLNPDRKGYPDVDLDWSADFRDNRLKPYLREFYGDEYCAQVATYMYYWGKAAIKASARILFPMSESVQIGTTLADALDDKPKLDLNKELDGSNPQFEELVNSRLEYKQTIELAKMIQGRLSGESIHASAYIVSPKKLTDIVPLGVNKDERARAQKDNTEIKNYIIQYPGDIVQDVLGLVKLDLLCVVDLEMMEMTCKTIERIYGCKLNLERIPLDDAAIWSMLQDHLVAGLFQLDGSEGMARVMDQVRPENIENINAIVALYRPGPMDYIPNYVDGKNHPEHVHYLDDRLEPILRDTYGVVCYQEQSMQITQVIGGFSGGDADAYRKASAKKHPEQLVPMGKQFVEGALANSTSQEVAEELWAQLVKFGSYAFNRCVTGDTLLHRTAACPNDKKYPGMDIPVEEVYRRFNASAARNSPDRPIRSKYRSPNPKRGLFISCRDADGRARRHKVKNVYQQGERDVYLVTLENGKSVKATDNHRFQVADGGYKVVSDLIVGQDELWCCDFVYDDSKTQRYNFSTVTDGSFAAGHRAAGTSYGSHRGFKEGAENPSWTGGGYTQFATYKGQFDGVCEQCGRHLDEGERFETHHVNGDRTDNSPENLMNLCVSCHKKLDYAMGRKCNGDKGYKTYLSRIVSVEYAGREMTYDVEIESEEHNFFANGICSHNSHSAAYALIAYRGAFLKAHFPECFFASLCTLKPKAKKTNKVPEYLDEARQMGVTVKPPHVNYSEAGFDVPEKGVIAFGLAGIGGVGAAAQVIVDERHAHGPFKDFSDFMTRVPRTVGKGALLPLMQHGALDGLGWSRRAMVESIDQIIDFRKRYFASQEQRKHLAMDLFSLGAPPVADEDEGKDILLTPPFDTEYNKRQMLEMEKRNFGTYLSGSPEDYRKLSRYATEQRIGRSYKQALQDAREQAQAKGGADMPAKPIHVGDINGYTDAERQNGTRVEFLCIVSDPVSKNRPNPFMFRSGKGCSVSIQDWGVLEESRTGFAPRIYKSRLTMFARTLEKVPLPQPGDLLHVVGKINIDKTGEWPNSVIVDELEVVPDDNRLIGTMGKDELISLQKRLARISESLHDPASDMYMSLLLEFPSQDMLEGFMASVTEGMRGTGHVLLSVSGDDSAPQDVALRPTVSVVNLARKFGAEVRKRRLPKAQSAMERMKLMRGDA